MTIYGESRKWFLACLIFALASSCASRNTATGLDRNVEWYSTLYVDPEAPQVEPSVRREVNNRFLEAYQAAARGLEGEEEYVVHGMLAYRAFYDQLVQYKGENFVNVGTINFGVSLETSLGWLQLDTTPTKCDVYEEGERIGYSDREFLMTAQKHKLEIVKQGWTSEVIEVEIEEKKRAMRSVKLRELGNGSTR